MPQKLFIYVIRGHDQYTIFVTHNCVLLRISFRSEGLRFSQARTVLSTKLQYTQPFVFSCRRSDHFEICLWNVCSKNCSRASVQQRVVASSLVLLRAEPDRCINLDEPERKIPQFQRQNLALLREVSRLHESLPHPVAKSVLDTRSVVIVDDETVF